MLRKYINLRRYIEWSLKVCNIKGFTFHVKYLKHLSNSRLEMPNASLSINSDHSSGLCGRQNTEGVGLISEKLESWLVG